MKVLILVTALTLTPPALAVVSFDSAGNPVQTQAQPAPRPQTPQRQWTTPEQQEIEAIAPILSPGVNQPSADDQRIKDELLTKKRALKLEILRLEQENDPSRMALNKARKRLLQLQLSALNREWRDRFPESRSDLDADLKIEALERAKEHAAEMSGREDRGGHRIIVIDPSGRDKPVVVRQNTATVTHSGGKACMQVGDTLDCQ
jgi:hypothetical protein